ncbi:hypothetical protein P154DRAFT_174652 [Amniculicola lignicola CBS 123094]|uniref:NAD(P)-binding protein n=1 Tax=Amniculicola lignicola CBS 123094 TaxID=1392246 RepID=A0A6A5WUD6_9PLEO|nr:hypothetical protein P154DRAFT_174652 [Amniculicola lignicola CBS 123094]
MEYCTSTRLHDNSIKSAKPPQPSFSTPNILPFQIPAARFMSKRKVALITGCSDPTSLGAALALNLLKRGWKVYATAIDVASMADLHRSGCEVLPLDVTKATDINAAAKIIGERLDLLVNNLI